MFCSECGTKINDAAKFCKSCGAAVPSGADVPAQPTPAAPNASSSPAPAPLRAPAVAPAVSPQAQRPVAPQSPPAVAPQARPQQPVPSFTPPPPSASVPPPRVGVALQPPPPGPTTSAVFAPPPAANAQQAAPAPAAAPQPFVLPAAPTPWPFQEKTTEWAASVTGSLGKSGFAPDTPHGSVVTRLIRAAMLDKTVYREVATDPRCEKEAWIVMAAIIGMVSFYPYMSTLGSFSSSSLTRLAAAAAIQGVAWVARVWIIQMLANMWLGSKLTFGQMFRPLAYAQAPSLLLFLPQVTTLVAVLGVATNTAAIREVTGCNTVQAVVLSVVSVIGVMICIGLASPIIYQLMQGM